MENVIEHEMYTLIFSATFFLKISHSKKNLTMYFINVHTLSGKMPLIFFRL
jgi:hypothetical protein